MESSGIALYSGYLWTTNALTASVFVDEIADTTKCSNWSSGRIVVEFYMFFVLIENLFLGYVSMSLHRKLDNRFISSCVIVTCFCGTMLAILLMVVPFAFTWKENQNFSGVFAKDARPLFDEGYFNEPHEGLNEIHQCQQSGTTKCKAIGFIFGFVLYTPLVLHTMICLDAVMAGFCWKRYSLRPHHISTLRLTMILCLVLTVAISFSLPVVEAGAHYHYDPFYRVCWLPTNTEHNMEIRFVLFAFGFLSIVILLHLISSYLLVTIVKLNNSSEYGYQEERENCPHISNPYTMNSKIWTSNWRTTLSIAFVPPAIYLPITVGFILKFTVFCPTRTLVWYNNLNRLSVLLVPMVLPALYLTLVDLYRVKAVSALKSLVHIKAEERVSPSITDETSSSECRMEDCNQHYFTKVWLNDGESYFIERYDKSNPEAQNGHEACRQSIAHQNVPVPQRCQCGTQDSKTGHSEAVGQWPVTFSNLQQARQIKASVEQIEQVYPRSVQSNPYSSQSFRQKNKCAPWRDCGHSEFEKTGERYRKKTPRLLRQMPLPHVAQPYWKHLSSSEIDRRGIRRLKPRDEGSTDSAKTSLTRCPSSVLRKNNIIFYPSRYTADLNGASSKVRRFSHVQISGRRLNVGNQTSCGLERLPQRRFSELPSSFLRKFQQGSVINENRLWNTVMLNNEKKEEIELNEYPLPSSQPTCDIESSGSSTPARSSRGAYENKHWGF